MSIRARGRIAFFSVAVFLAQLATGQDTGLNPSSPVACDRKLSGHPVTKGIAHDRELQAISDMATVVAPEFGADILIRVSESTKTRNRQTKIRLLKKAFYLANSAEQPIKRTTSVFLPDTRSGYLALAFRLENLDTISLQSRVVDDLLKLDTKLARDLLEQIRLPVLSPVDCGEPLTYDVNLLYEVLGSVSRDGFTGKEKSEGRQVALLKPYLYPLQSHAQIGPATKLLLNAGLSYADLSRTANMLAESLLELGGDERSFAATNMRTDANSTPGAIATLIEALNAKQINSFALLGAFREYLVSNFGGSRCGEMANRSSLPEAVQFFNDRFLLVSQWGQITPIKAEELKAARIGPKFADVTFWQSPQSKQLFEGAKGLLFGDSRARLTTQQRTTPNWSSRLLEFLNQLSAWKSDSEASLVDFFCEKSLLYTLLINVVPNGPERSKAISDFVEFLEQNSEPPINRLEWILQVDRLLSGTVGAGDRGEVMQTFVNSRDPALSVYGRLERWDPRNLQHASKPTVARR